MASIIAAPTSLDITAVAGDPLTLLFNISLADSNGNPLPWSDFTSPTVYVGKATAEQTSLEPVVTMPASGQVDHGGIVLGSAYNKQYIHIVLLH